MEGHKGSRVAAAVTTLAALKEGFTRDMDATACDLFDDVMALAAERNRHDNEKAEEQKQSNG